MTILNKRRREKDFFYFTSLQITSRLPKVNYFINNTIERSNSIV